MKYLNLDTFQDDLYNDLLSINTVHLIDVHKSICRLNINQQMEAFNLYFNYFVKKAKRNINYFQQQIEDNQLYKDNIKIYDESIQLLHIKKEFCEFKLKQLEYLLGIKNSNFKYDYQENKSYTIKYLNDAYLDDTAEYIDDIYVTKAIILDNSMFSNLYNEFILGIPYFFHSTEEHLNRYILVSPLNGIYTDIPMMIPIHNIQK